MERLAVGRCPCIAYGAKDVIEITKHVVSNSPTLWDKLMRMKKKIDWNKVLVWIIGLVLLGGYFYNVLREW